VALVDIYHSPYYRFMFRKLTRTGITLTLFACLFPASGFSREPAPYNPSYTITTATLAALIRAGVPMVIFDARTGTHNDGRRIPGAVAMPPDASAEQVARLVNSKQTLIITYCKDPECPSASALAANLRKLGYANVLENPGGIDGWAAAGQRIVREGARQSSGKR